MSDGTAIQWTEATWNPITGCSVVSPGCTNCYAMKLAGTRLQHHSSRTGLTRDTKAGPVWTGEVRFNEGWLDQPLRWRRPRRVFVVAHGDLFHENVPDEWIDLVFAVMLIAPHHTFQVLTKRPARAQRYLLNPETPYRVGAALGGLVMRGALKGAVVPSFGWPLPNVWLGTSVEDQKRADERIPILLDTPAAVRWISAEPLLGPLDLRTYLFPIRGRCLLDWVVVGCESGRNARPFELGWASQIKEGCSDAGVAFFCKQLQRPGSRRLLHNIADFPVQLQVQEYPARCPKPSSNA